MTLLVLKGDAGIDVLEVLESMDIVPGSQDVMAEAEAVPDAPSQEGTVSC